MERKPEVPYSKPESEIIEIDGIKKARLAFRSLLEHSRNRGANKWQTWLEGQAYRCIFG